MPGRVEGKVAFITGAARGQGRSHALRLAQEGADIIAVDICGPVDGVSTRCRVPGTWPRPSKLVEALDRRIVATQADVRDFDALKAAVDDGVAQLGRLDIVVANAGIGALASQPGQDGPEDLAGHDRHQPDRGLAHRQGGRSRT